MARLTSLPDSQHLGHRFKRYPKGVRTLRLLTDELWRGVSELSFG